MPFNKYNFQQMSSECSVLSRPLDQDEKSWDEIEFLWTEPINPGTEERMNFRGPMTPRDEENENITLAKTTL